jgi:hypothetical protein
MVRFDSPRAGVIDVTVSWTPPNVAPVNVTLYVGPSAGEVARMPFGCPRIGPSTVCTTASTLDWSASSSPKRLRYEKQADQMAFAVEVCNLGDATVNVEYSIGFTPR